MNVINPHCEGVKSDLPKTFQHDKTRTLPIPSKAAKFQGPSLVRQAFWTSSGGADCHWSRSDGAMTWEKWNQKFQLGLAKMAKFGWNFLFFATCSIGEVQEKHRFFCSEKNWGDPCGGPNQKVVHPFLFVGRPWSLVRMKESKIVKNPTKKKSTRILCQFNRSSVFAGRNVDWWWSAFFHHVQLEPVSYNY